MLDPADRKLPGDRGALIFLSEGLCVVSTRTVCSRNGLKCTLFWRSFFAWRLRFSASMRSTIRACSGFRLLLEVFPYANEWIPSDILLFALRGEVWKVSFAGFFFRALEIGDFFLLSVFLTGES